MVRTRRKFRLLDYMSDALVRSYGSTLEEAFANAAVAMMAVMVDLRGVSAEKLRREVKVEGFDTESLLYNWLEAVLVKKDIDREVFRTAEVKISKSGEGLTIKGTLHGDHADPHRFKRDVKAVTYHEMSIRRRRGRYVVTFLLDL